MGSKIGTPGLGRTRRRGAMGETEAAAARAANASDRVEKEIRQMSMKKAKAAKGRRGTVQGTGDIDQSIAAIMPNAAEIALRIGASAHGPDCPCLHCSRRKQLLLWRDTMQDAQSRRCAR